MPDLLTTSCRTKRSVAATLRPCPQCRELPEDGPLHAPRNTHHIAGAKLGTRSGSVFERLAPRPLPDWKKGAEEETVKARRGRGRGKLVLCANGSVVTRTGGQGIHGGFDEEVRYHQPPAVNYLPCLENNDLPCRVKSESFSLQDESPFSKQGGIVLSRWLVVA